jgi:hypothetical protein
MKNISLVIIIMFKYNMSSIYIYYLKLINIMEKFQKIKLPLIQY